jgi:hypothetical protein
VIGATADLEADATLGTILTAGLVTPPPRRVIDNRRKLGPLWKVSTHRRAKILAQPESTGRIRTNGEHLFFIGFLSKKTTKKSRFPRRKTRKIKGLHPPPYQRLRGGRFPQPPK